jgi:hypothetical protein
MTSTVTFCDSINLDGFEKCPSAALCFIFTHFDVPQVLLISKDCPRFPWIPRPAGGSSVSCDPRLVVCMVPSLSWL